MKNKRFNPKNWEHWLKLAFSLIVSLVAVQYMREYNWIVGLWPIIAWANAIIIEMYEDMVDDYSELTDRYRAVILKQLK